MNVCPTCGERLAATGEPCPRCEAAAIQRKVAAPPPAEAVHGPAAPADVSKLLRPPGEFPAEPLQDAWNKQFAEIGFVAGLVVAALSGLVCIVQGIINAFAARPSRDSDTGTMALFGLICLICSPLAGVAGAVALGSIGLFLQGAEYLLSGRYRRTPDARAVFERIQEMEDEEAYREMFGEDLGPDADPEGIQSRPGPDTPHGTGSDPRVQNDLP
jgi:hypothetical protein